MNRWILIITSIIRSHSVLQSLWVNNMTFVPPMLLEKRVEPFDDPRYIYEPKIDGHRLLLAHENGSMRLYTRHENECTRQYPELHAVPTNDDVILDGEVCRIGREGTIDFEAVMERFRMTKAPRIKSAAINEPVHYVVFDILFRNGKDLRGLSLMERKAILAEVLDNNAHFSRSIYVEESGITLFNTISERKMEGIVAKRKDSVYVGRRSDSWLKIINYTYADVHIAGYRKDQFGWLAQYNGRPAGIIELAVPATHKRAFYGVAQGIITREDRNFVYLEPRLKAKVRFRNWTSNGMLRTPEFVDFVL